MRRPLLSPVIIPVLLVAGWAVLARAWLTDGLWWGAPVAALLVLSWFVLIASLKPELQWFGPALARVSGRDGLVALTFDDGPDPEYTPRVLDLLDGAGARGTFFLIGHRVEQHPDVARQIVERGHQVAHHGHDHRWDLMFRPRRLADDFLRGIRAIRRATGRVPRFYRPPVGVVAPEVLEVSRIAGMRLAAWSVRPFDGRIDDPEEVRRRVRSKIRAGDIVLLHDAPRVGGPPPPAVEALPGILEDLRGRGLRSVSVAELCGEPPYQESDIDEIRYRRRSPIPPLVALTLAALLATSATQALAAEPGGLPPTLVAAAEELGQAPTVQARFVQTKESVLFVEPVVQSGQLLLRRSDGRLLWLYDEGTAVLMVDGKFYPAGVTAEEVGPEGAAGYSIPGGGDFTKIFAALFTLQPEALATWFDGADLGEGRYLLTPTSTSAKSLFVAVTLTIGGEPSALRRVEMAEATGDSTTVAFEDVRLGEPIAAERFMTPTERSATR